MCSRRYWRLHQMLVHIFQTGVIRVACTLMFRKTQEGWVTMLINVFWRCTRRCFKAMQVKRICPGLLLQFPEGGGGSFGLLSPFCYQLWEERSVSRGRRMDAALAVTITYADEGEGAAVELAMLRCTTMIHQFELCKNTSC